MSVAVFFILGAISIVAALTVIATKKPVSSALALVVVMCCVAGLFALMGAIFLAALQVIVYAGAIMVLFLFVIMLLNLRKDEFGHDPYRFQKYLGVLFAALIMIQGVFIVNAAMKDVPESSADIEIQATTSENGEAPANIDFQSAPMVAETLFTKFAYPFEVTSILLLGAIIGSVVIAKKRKAGEGQEGDEA